MPANIMACQVQPLHVCVVCGARADLASSCLICKKPTHNRMLCCTHQKVFQSHGIPKVRNDDGEE